MRSQFDTEDSDGSGERTHDVEWIYQDCDNHIR